jgi:polysaccharide biosynthesis protein PslH
MNILQICNKSPYPPSEGGPIAMYNLAEGLHKAGHNVDILAISTNKFFVDIETLPLDYRNKTSFSVVYIDTSVRFINAFFNLFSVKSYHVQRFDSQEMHKRLIEILQSKKFDVIQLETIYVGPYVNTIRKYSDARIVLRAHNIEHLIWERIAAKVKNTLKRFYLSYLAMKLRKYEDHVFNMVDGIACISEIDADFIKMSGVTIPVKTIPFGMKVPENMQIPEFSGELSFFHIGSMDWMPNQEGMKWFLDYCMPIIATEFPQNKVVLAGRNMPSWVSTYKFSNLEIIGEVNNAAEFISTHDIMFVPLFSGSGVRIKIIEGMSLGKVIISTTIGAEGIDYTDGKNILIADTKEQFIEKLRFCINNTDQCKMLSINASNLIVERHNINNTTRILVEFYQKELGLPL